MKTIKKLLQQFLVTTFALMPSAVLALENPRSPIAATGISLGTIKSIVNIIAQTLITFGVIIAVIFIIWGGITWMAAGGDEEKATEAKTRIKNGIFGAAIVLGVGVILQTLSGLITTSFFST